MTVPSYDVRTWSSAQPEEVFALLADANTWKTWAGPMIMKSWFSKEGDPAPGGVGAVRRLGARGFATREEITEYDPPHYLAYTILGKAPMRDYRAIVSFDRHDGGTRITWAGAFEPVIPGTGRLLAWVLKRIVGGMAVRLGRYSSKHSAPSGQGQ
ncbi:MAG: SRPBCC family protein [Frankiaceae bacterium]|nr:SRPBCC family protein [Frankiaceae bacterium]